VRQLSKTVCLVVLLLSAPAGAQIDSPGFVSFHFLAEPDAVYRTFEQVPLDAPLTYTRNKAYLSSDASEFEDTGVRVWTGFDLEGPDGPRHGMLILDVNLQNPSALRAEYIETRNDHILFNGYLLASEAHIQDLWLDGGDAGSVEGEFECIFMDPANQAEGSRVLLAGRFVTDARPQSQIPNIYYEEDTYVETGCGSDVYVEDDYEDSGCEGSDDDYDDDYDYGGSCEGDTYDSGSDSGCEGDSYDSGYSDSSSCEGDSYDSYDSSDDSGLDCEGDEAYAATLKPAPRKRRRPNPLRALMRMFPEIVGISFIVYLKRRNRICRR